MDAVIAQLLGMRLEVAVQVGPGRQGVGRGELVDDPHILGDAVTSLLAGLPHWEKPAVREDLGGIQRVITTRRKPYQTGPLG